MARLKWGCDNLRQILKKTHSSMRMSRFVSHYPLQDEHCLKWEMWIVQWQVDDVDVKVDVYWNNEKNSFHGSIVFRLRCTMVPSRRWIYPPQANLGTALEHIFSDISDLEEKGRCGCRMFHHWDLKYGTILLNTSTIYIFCAVNVPGFTLIIRESGHGYPLVI